MKNLLFVLAISAMGFFMAGCNNYGGAFTDFIRDYRKDTLLSAQDSTTIAWDNTPIDLGKAKLGEVVAMEFGFKNTGSKPLVIDSVFVTCGCTTFSLPAGPVMPGKTSKIKARYDTKDQTVAHNIKDIYLRANTKNTPYHTLTFKVEIIDK